MPTEPSVRVEGPPSGLPSGRYDVPRWSILAFGGAIIALGVIALIARAVRARRRP